MGSIGISSSNVVTYHTKGTLLIYSENRVILASVICHNTCASQLIDDRQRMFNNDIRTMACSCDVKLMAANDVDKEND